MPIFLTNRSTEMRKTSPEFLLRSVEPQSIAKKLLDNQYNTLDIPKKKKYTIKIKTLFQDTYNNHTIEDEIYDNKRWDTVYRVYTTNNLPYKQFTTGVVQTVEPCLWCRKKIENEPIPLPTQMKIKKDRIIFYGTYSFCSESCALAQLYDELKIDPCNPLYKDSFALLKHIHYLRNGDYNFTRALDWRLLCTNGGCMSEDEYRNETKNIKKMPNIIFAPLRQEYEAI